MNPEFKRNLWLSFSLHRLLAMPVTLGLVFLAIGMSNPFHPAETIYGFATTLFIFIVWLWGLRNANSSIVDELRDKTWDQQRMSALSPWSMTWGKLFGATSFTWYGGLVCFVVGLVAGFSTHGTTALISMLTLVTTGVMLHAASIALNLHTSRIEARIVQRGGLGWITLLIIFLLISSASRLWSTQAVAWWGMSFDSVNFLFLSSVVFGGWAVFAAYRAMCNALQVRTLPWAWPLFGCVLSVYLAGLAPAVAETPGAAFFAIATAVVVIMTYVALFSEPTNIVAWQRLRVRQQRGDWHGWLTQLPLWPTTLALAFLFSLLGSTTSIDVSAPSWTAMAFGIAPLGIALMLLRDVCIFLFFAFSSRPQRAVSATLFYLILLNGLLPFLARVSNLDDLAYMLLPINHSSPWQGVSVLVIHALIAFSMVAWRLRRNPI